MKCKEIDIIEYIEGSSSRETKAHVESCKRCTKESIKLKEFSNLISTHYAEGKNLEKELNERLKSIDISKMKKLPDNIIRKIAEIKEKSLMSKLRTAVGTHKKDIKELVEGFLSPRVQAMPASPKDITKIKRAKRKKKVT